MARFVALLTLTCLRHVIAPLAGAGEPRAVCPTFTIEAVEDDNVTLPCHLDPPTSVMNYAVDWKRVDLNEVVYSYRHQHENHDDQMDQYRGRTTLNLEDLSRGNLTLWISSVQTSDSGPYRCFVSKLRTSCNTTLIVESKDQQNRTQRDDSSTTAPPLQTDSPGAGNRKLVLSIVVPAVALIVIVIIIVLVVKRGAIQERMRRLRGRTKKKAAETNGRELKRLTTPTKDEEDPDVSAADDLGNNEQEV